MTDKVLEYKRKLAECDDQIKKYTGIIEPHINTINLLKISQEKREILSKEFREHVKTIPGNLAAAQDAFRKIQMSGKEKELDIILDFVKRNLFESINTKSEESEFYNPAYDDEDFYKRFDDAYNILPIPICPENILPENMPDLRG